MKLFIGNLAWDASEDELKAHFEAFGPVKSVRIVQDNYTGRSKGFGFVEYTEEGHADAAINALNEKDFMGRPLRVSRARTDSEREAARSSGPRGGHRGGPRGGDRGGDRGERRSFRPRFDDSQYS